MPKQMTAEERAAYQRDYRARKKREQAEAGLIELRPKTATPQPAPQQPVAPMDLNPHPLGPVEFAAGASGKPWKSAEAFVAPKTHEACDRRIAELTAEVQARIARYQPLLDMLLTIYAQTAGQKDEYKAVIRMDTIRELRALCDLEVPF